MGRDDKSDLTSVSVPKSMLDEAAETHSEHDSGISTAKSTTDLSEGVYRGLNIKNE